MNENFVKIKNLHVEKQRPFQVLLAMEILLLVVGLVGLFGKTNRYEYNTDAMTCNFGSYSEEYNGYVTEENGRQGYAVEFTDIALPKGTYRVQVHYVTDTDMQNYCEVIDEQLNVQTLRTNGAQFFSGLNQTNFDMWLLRDAQNMKVLSYYNGVGMLAVQGLTIVQTNAWNRILLFCMLCTFTMINCVYCYVQYDKKYAISVKSKTITFGLGLVILFAALPLMVDYVKSAGDLGYHLMRVEGIKDGILAGQFPVRISPEWQQGYGYASPIFYGETILYLAGLFRLIGFSVTASYLLFMFCIVVATVLIAYYCFKKIFGEAYIGLLCSMLYSISIYRIYKTYYCGSWGETFGIMLLPLFAYGFYRVFTQDVHEKSYKRSWIPLTIGFSLVVQSHLLTGEMVGAFTIILCIIMWKKVFRPQTFLVLAKTVIYSVLLSAWFLVPFVDYMLTGDFVIQHVSARTIQYRGLFPAHLIFTYFRSGDNVFFDERGMYDTAATGVGIAPVFALLIFVYLLWANKTGALSKEETGMGKIAGFFSVLAMLMSLSLFPWDRIQALGSVAATLVSSIQFPNRFLTIANVGLTAVAGVVAKLFMSWKNKMVTSCYAGGMVFLLVISSVFMLDDMIGGTTPIRIYNSEGMGTGYIAGGEYLPHGAKASKFMYHDPIASGNVTVKDYEKQSLGATAQITNGSEKQESVAFSLLYYKGYQARVVESGQALDCYAGENHEVTVNVPAGFDGTVKVAFVSPWYWRLGEIVTVITLAVMVLSFHCQRQKENKVGGAR